MKKLSLSFLAIVLVLSSMPSSLTFAAGDDGCRLSYMGSVTDGLLSLRFFRSLKASNTLSVIEAAYDHPRFNDPNKHGMERIYRKVLKHCSNITYEETRGLLRDIDLNRSICRDFPKPGQERHFILSRAELRNKVVEKAFEKFPDRCK